MALQKINGRMVHPSAVEQVKQEQPEEGAPASKQEGQAAQGDTPRRRSTDKQAEQGQQG